MYLISSGKQTVLSGFDELVTKSTYHHANNETTDFQFYPRQQIFVKVNKKSGLEILRIKENENDEIFIQRVRKLNIDNVYCVACTKQSVEEMALGLSNGQLKIYNYKNSEFVHRFNGGHTRNSVLYLDYNGSDEYISSVLESGQINIYGIKTKTKMDTINIDGYSTLARFHPTKRFQLSIASYKGMVSIYDIQSKRKTFFSSDAHAAPCRDLCMPLATPDTLISVGYDCVINIFDTRRKTQRLKLNHCHPLSAVAVTECGTYFCVGNLKGELITYDMRNTKKCIVSKKVHDCAVTRVAFVPKQSDRTTMSFCSDKENQSDAVLKEPMGSKVAGTESNANAAHRDSFCDFLDFQSNKGTEKMSSRFITRKDSFDWETLSSKRNAAFSTETRRISFGGNTVSPNNSSDVLVRDRCNTSTKLLQKTSCNLVQIQEEQPISSVLQSNNSNSESDKENLNFDSELGERLHILPSNCKSTPNRATTTTTSVDIAKQISDLRSEMNTRFEQLEFELKLNSETNKWHIFTQNFNLWNQQIEKNEGINDALSILLQSDPFVNEFIRLKEENELLKGKLQQLLHN